MMLLKNIKTKFSVAKYIEFSSVLMIFLQGFSIKGLHVIDIKLFYFFLIINSLLLYTKYGFRLNKYIFLIFTFLSIHGIINYIIYDFPWGNLIKQIVGIFIVIVYYYNVIVLFDLKNLFNIYLKLAVIFCVIALIFYPTGILDKELERLDGLMSEPSKFIVVNIPALYYFLKKRKYLNAFVLLFGFFLAKSSSGYLAILIMFLFLSIRKSTIKYLGLTIIPIFIIALFLKNNEFYQDRLEALKENFEIFQTKTFKNDTNISSFVLLKSAYVSINNFKDHPLGTGIGSFSEQHDKYIKLLSMPRYTVVYDIENFNREDANSLFLRTLSDLGIFGLGFIILFLFLGFTTYFVNYDLEKKTIAIGVFIYFLIKLLRMGHYFPEEQYFFLFLFIFTLPKIKFNLSSSSINNKCIN